MMGKQFAELSCRYGAPMGRASFGADCEPKTLRLFRVRLDAGGYDDGGAYWGTGKPLWCATDGADYRQFVRAGSRLLAIIGLEIRAEWLIRKPKREIDNLRELAKLDYQNCQKANETLTELGF